MVTQLMGADLNSILKSQQLSDDHVKFLIYQILRGLKVCQFLRVSSFTSRPFQLLSFAYVFSISIRQASFTG